MRVLVVDDHSLFRDGLISLLKAADYDVIGEAGDGESAVREALRLHPDLILMDINMPRMNGLDALRLIRGQLPETKVVILTVSEIGETLLEAIEAGANGYLLKNLDSHAFIASLHSLERGEAAITGEMVSQLMQQISQRSRQAPARQEPAPRITLTDREREMLRFIARGLSNREIAGKLFISENTVKYHIKNVLQKFGLKNRAEAAAYAIQQGLGVEE
ncbi:MAG TPA: response regulator transcription factor [Anaerolineales bacterium]